MSKQLFLMKYLLFIFIIFISLCGFVNAGKITSLKIADTKMNYLLAQDSGKLNMLWAHADDFKKLTGKTIFNFRFSLNDSITLHGWHTEGASRHRYSNITSLQLYASKSDILITDKKDIFTSIKFGKSTYFGNLLLYRSDLKKIRRLIFSISARYMLFVPKIMDEHVYYDIVLTKEKPGLAGNIYTVLSSAISANPSPPRKY